MYFASTRFIDFKLAYDKIIRSELFVVMRKLGFEPKLIRLVVKSLTESKSRIRIGVLDKVTHYLLSYSTWPWRVH